MATKNWFGFPGELPPPLALNQLVLGKWVSQAVAVAADLDVADRLASGPRTSAELAAEIGVNEDGLYRLLRALANADVLVEEPGRRFALTEIGQFLRRDVPGSLHGWARMAGHAPWWRPWGELLHSVRTGEPAFPVVFGEGPFEYLAKHPEEAAVFNESMTSISRLEAEAVAAGYDFSGIGTLADVGGGHGFLLGTILRAHANLRGLLFDLPHVVAGASEVLRTLGVEPRCRIAGGSFFDSGPAGADAVILKHVLHDWDDADATKILANCAGVLPSGGRVLVAEMVVPPPGEKHFAKLLDLEMLVITDRGRERTEEEYGALFRAAGLRPSRLVPTLSPVSIVEAVKE
ncbi:MAG: methyltransferase [Candidatus Binatia bacterium]